jgi:hypothetical protein
LQSTASKSARSASRRNSSNMASLPWVTSSMGGGCQP